MCLCIFLSECILTEVVDLVVVLQVIHMQHHLLDLAVDEPVDFHHGLTRSLTIPVVIRLERDRFAELDEHFRPCMEVIGVVVA